MKNNRMGLIFRLTAYICAALFVLCALIYGFKTDFGFYDFAKTPDDGVYPTAYVYDEEMKSMQGLYVDWFNGPVSVRFYDGSIICVKESAKEELNEDEKLYLEVSGRELSVRWNSALLQLDVQQAPKKLEIFLPIAFYETLNEIEITNSAGNIEVEELAAEDITIESGSGEVHLKNITAENFSAKTISGNLLCQQITGTERLRIRSNSGDITLAGVTAGSAELDTTSGDMTMSGTLTAVECGTVSGNIQADFATWPEKMDIHTVTGHTDILAPETNDGFVCRFKSVSGAMDSDFAMQKSGNIYTCKDGLYTLRFQTTSGNVSMNQKLG